MPGYCPKLDSLYELILSVLLRIPLGLKEHVTGKFDLVQTQEANRDDHTNFIAEIRPVLEEFKVSLFCVECLDIESTTSSIIKDTLAKSRKEFKLLLNLYITKVLTPHKSHLISGQFDRSNYLQRLNKAPFEKNSRILDFLKFLRIFMYFYYYYFFIFLLKIIFERFSNFEIRVLF